MATHIYIDDTGTSQFRSGFEYDTSNSASWCAIVLNDIQYCEAVNFMGVELKSLNSFIGLNEFHFTEIFSGSGAYRKNNIDFENRIAIFNDFALFSRRFQFPVFIQSFGEDDYGRIKLKKTLKTIVAGVDLNNYKDLSLFLLLMNVKRYLDSHPEYSAPYMIVIDEGRKKKGTKQPCIMFGDLLKDKQILYCSSAEEPMLQLADFVAFTLNRCKWLNMKDPSKISEYDLRFLKMASDANFNAPHMKKVLLPADSDRNKKYKELLDEAYTKNEILPEETLEEFIQQLITRIEEDQKRKG